MDQQIARYIINYFPRLLTDDEAMAIRHSRTLYKISDGPHSKERDALFLRQGWLTKDPLVLNLLKDGCGAFEQNVGKRIMAECSEKVFFNNCPKCGQLARTPYARQCRYCRHNWHSLNVAKFHLSNSFQLRGRHFFLLGEITGGEVIAGDLIDLTMLGLGSRPKIEAIEFAVKNLSGKPEQSIGLGTNDLHPDEKEYIKKRGSFGTALDIIRNSFL